MLDQCIWELLFDDGRWELLCRKRAWIHYCNKCCISRQDKYSFLGKIYVFIEANMLDPISLFYILKAICWASFLFLYIVLLFCFGWSFLKGYLLQSNDYLPAYLDRQGTVVVAGRARAVVVGVGTHTAMGGIHDSMLRTEDVSTLNPDCSQ